MRPAQRVPKCARFRTGQSPERVFPGCSLHGSEQRSFAKELLNKLHRRLETVRRWDLRVEEELNSWMTQEGEY